MVIVALGFSKINIYYSGVFRLVSNFESVKITFCYIRDPIFVARDTPEIVESINLFISVARSFVGHNPFLKLAKLLIITKSPRI